MTTKMVIVEAGSFLSVAKQVHITSGGEVAWTTFRTALVSKGLSAIVPSMTSDQTALSRATESLISKDTVKASVARGIWTTQRKHRESGEQLRYTQTGRTKIVGGLPTFVPDGEMSQEDLHRKTTELREAYGHAKEFLSPGDLRSWISTLLTGPLGAQKINDGHAYVVPRDRWVLLGQITEIVGSFGFGLPDAEITYTSGVLQEAADAIRTEAVADMLAIQAFLDEQTEDSGSERQDKARIVREGTLQSIEAKLKRFGTLYQKPFQDVEAQVQEMRSKLQGTYVKLKAAELGQEAEGFRPLELDDGPRSVPTTEPAEPEDERFKSLLNEVLNFPESASE